MRKTLLILFLIAILSLTGCMQETMTKVQEETAKVEYIAKTGKIVLSSTDAYITLFGLYQNQTNYGASEWKNQFFENKQIIEDALREMTSISPPIEIQDSHNQFVQALELTVEINNTIEEGLEKKEIISTEINKKIEEATNLFTIFGKEFTDYADVPKTNK